MQRFSSVVNYSCGDLDWDGATVAREEGGFCCVVVADVPSRGGGWGRFLGRRVRIGGRAAYEGRARRCREELLTGVTEGFAGGIVYVQEARLPIEDVHEVVELLDGESAG
jgi:hypothetical protein